MRFPRLSRWLRLTAFRTILLNFYFWVGAFIVSKEKKWKRKFMFFVRKMNFCVVSKVVIKDSKAKNEEGQISLKFVSSTEDDDDILHRRSVKKIFTKKNSTFLSLHFTTRWFNFLCNARNFLLSYFFDERTFKKR